MLNRFYRFVLVNKTDQILSFTTGGGSVNLKMTGVIVTPSTGKLAYALLSDDDFSFNGAETIAVDGEVISDEIDNETNLYINLLAQVEVIHDLGASAVGSFDLYYASGDLSTQLETDANGYVDAETNKLTFVGSLTWHASASNDDLIRSPVFTV